MSFFQPLVTTAFSSYAVSRGAYAGRTQEAGNQNDTVDSTAQVGIASPSQETQQAHGIVKTEGTNWPRWNDWPTDRDSGKPQSASGDVLDISDEARQTLEAQAQLNQEAQEKVDDAKLGQRLQDQADEIDKSESRIAVDGSLKSDADAKEASLNAGSSSDLTTEDKQQIDELKARDAEVRLHEQQHVSTGGQYVTGGPSYTYQTGPDGNRYAIGGEVGIDVAPIEGNPEATIQKMQTVAAAALAPAEPSGQDYKVAAAARQAEAQARAELNAQKAEEANGGNQVEEESESESDSLNASKSLNEEESKDSTTRHENVRSSSAISSNFAAASTYRMVSGQTGSSSFSAFA